MRLPTTLRRTRSDPVSMPTKKSRQPAFHIRSMTSGFTWSRRMPPAVQRMGLPQRMRDSQNSMTVFSRRVKLSSRKP